MGLCGLMRRRPLFRFSHGSLRISFSWSTCRLPPTRHNDGYAYHLLTRQGPQPFICRGAIYDAISPLPHAGKILVIEPEEHIFEEVISRAPLAHEFYIYAAAIIGHAICRVHTAEREKSLHATLHLAILAHLPPEKMPPAVRVRRCAMNARDESFASR